MKLYLLSTTMILLSLLSDSSLAEPLNLKQTHEISNLDYVVKTRDSFKLLSSKQDISGLITLAKTIAEDTKLEDFTRELLLEKSISHISTLPETKKSREWLTALTAYESKSKIIHYDSQHEIVSGAFSIARQAQLVLDQWNINDLETEFLQNIENTPVQFIRNFKAKDANFETSSTVKLKAAKSSLGKLDHTQRIALSKALEQEQHDPEIAVLVFHNAMHLGDTEKMLKSIVKMPDQQAFDAYRAVNKNDERFLSFYHELTKHPYFSSLSLQQIALHANYSPASLELLFDKLKDPNLGGMAAASLSKIEFSRINAIIRTEILSSTNALYSKRLLLTLKLHPDPHAQSELQYLLSSNLVTNEIRSELAAWKK